MRTPRLIITSGEPAGIGPDVCIAAAARDWPCQIVVAGDEQLLRARAEQLHVDLTVRPYEPTTEPIAHRAGRVDVLDVRLHRPAHPGKLDAANAPCVLAMLDRACEGCRSGEFDALVTAPVQKSVINDAGIAFSGHTEYLAERCAASPVMMLVCGSLRVALATTHLPLRAVSDAITPELLSRVLHIMDHDLRTYFGIVAPRILVCGLNPHAGEGGHLGSEELQVLIPALERLRRAGLNVQGPIPADTAFTPHMLEQGDAVLAMYHDQGLPVIKHAGFDTAVNVTLGLPIIRTSVDHGTALSLAGSGRANASSLFAAIELAMQLSMQAQRVRPD